ncbi:MAG: flagellar basal body-associated FliL family protein [Sulfitobacter litoralis]|jgi:flagellar FliL protein|uniref:Flagellar protein FliL n=2 Tax=root TaxID=1 RepID=A0A1H0P4R3_9RHOB|nr:MULTISPECIES: flagellar basal body-associated FliL family protein [Sulfitobacter]MBQ0718012.1 flagellar basal body-associated FliL family protein [Sulfitobacter litoralis]MBQ0767543.1 flagellar basal body-associated FliL family protein [Sulfitobacter litoralis]MBQ0800478.1 flagellar basal body-associated FliL family protein [Sulfitobacter litoralis]MCF7728181.1 flagellar basal body protein FliL [Sulfitobacter sp. M22]MCF7779304.1 flagellar basal body protein FliL [Sulfitobacter sp. M220]|tara:strand:- start:5956 stop:6597 length:642 start_codon:yes stop_codon:yes gene_type:complete
MADKAKKKPAAAKQGTPADAADRPRGSRKMLIAAALMCVVSLGGGFFLARAAYVKDAEAFEPEYKSDEAEHADAKDNDAAPQKPSDETHGEAETDDHADGEKDAKAADTGLLDLGEMLTNIQGFDQNGSPTSVYLKVNLMVAYRPDDGADKLMAERQPFMRDLFNGYLRGLTENDVRGMAGILYIKAELLKRARAAVGNDLPQEILIKDLIVQ